MAKKLIRPIRSEADHDAAFNEIERYFENEPKPGTTEADRFDLHGVGTWLEIGQGEEAVAIRRGGYSFVSRAMDRADVRIRHRRAGSISHHAGNGRAKILGAGAPDDQQ